MSSASNEGEKGLAGLVQDWGGFEELVAAIHRSSSDVQVERGVELPAKEGRTYKIDVVIRSRQGLHEIMTIVECKWWGDRVGRDQITHLKHVREQVGAQKAVCFTSVGFQAGADTVARAHDIGLFVVRPMTESDWGQPGKVIDLFIQIYKAAISPLGFPRATVIAPRGTAHVGTFPRPKLAEDAELPSADRKSTLKIRDLVRELRQMAFDRAIAKRRVWHNGAEGTGYVAVTCKDVELIGGPFQIQLGQFSGLIARLDVDIVLEVHQRRVVVDRGRDLDFALVIEDFILGQRYAGSKRIGVATTDVVSLDQSTASAERPVQNGDIVCVLAGGFSNYSVLRAAKLRQDPNTVLIASES